LPAMAIAMRRRPRVFIGAIAGLLLAAVAAGIAIGTIAPSAGSGAVGRTVVRAVSADRVTLWRQAIDVARAHPVTGVGPGRLAEASALAGSDRDLRNAHDEFLQQAAEIGIPGAAILLLV